jgi:hypothetical protein
VTMLSPEARRRAKEIAAAAPPFSPAIRDQIRLILWGSVVAEPSPQESATQAADAA